MLDLALKMPTHGAVRIRIETLNDSDASLNVTPPIQSLPKRWRIGRAPIQIKWNSRGMTILRSALLAGRRKALAGFGRQSEPGIGPGRAPSLDLVLPSAASGNDDSWKGHWCGKP